VVDAVVVVVGVVVVAGAGVVGAAVTEGEFVFRTGALVRGRATFVHLHRLAGQEPPTLLHCVSHHWSRLALGP